MDLVHPFLSLPQILGIMSLLAEDLYSILYHLSCLVLQKPLSKCQHPLWNLQPLETGRTVSIIKCISMFLAINICILKALLQERGKCSLPIMTVASCLCSNQTSEISCELFFLSFVQIWLLLFHLW